MGTSRSGSWLSRPPKLAPGVSLVLGVVCIPLGFLVQGPVGGGLIGGGIGAILMGIWDFARLKYVAWRRLRNLDGPDERLGGSA